MRGRLKWLALAAAAAAILLLLPRESRPGRRAPSPLSALLLFARPLVADLMLGDFFARLEDDDFLALDRARRILELRPDDDDVRELVATRLAFDIALQADDESRQQLWVREAAALFREGLVEHPNSPALHFWLGILYLRNGNALRAPGVNVEELAATHLVMALSAAGRTADLDPATLAARALAATGADRRDLELAADLARRIQASPAFAELERVAHTSPEAAQGLASIRDALAPIAELAAVHSELAANPGQARRTELEQRKHELLRRLAAPR